jgi:hypothetical protein
VSEIYSPSHSNYLGPSLPFLALYTCSSDDDERLRTAPRDTTAAKRALLISFLKVVLSRVGTVGIPDNHQAAPGTIEYTLNPITLLEHQSFPRDSLATPDLTPDPDATPTGVREDRPPLDIPVPSASSGSPTLWPLPDVFASGTMEIVSPIPDELADGLNIRAFGDTPNLAALIPIPIDHNGTPGLTVPHALLIVGLNTRRPYDADYAKWLTAIASAFSNRLAVVLQMELDAEVLRERIMLDKAKSKFFMTVSHGRPRDVLQSFERF